MHRLAVVLLLLAGCTRPPHAPPMPTDAMPTTEAAPPKPKLGTEVEQPPAAASPALKVFERTYQLRSTEVAAADGGSQFGGNCVMFDDPVHVVSGNATVTWTPGPATPPMELLFAVRREVVAVASGTGEATIGFSALDLPDAPDEAPLLWQVAKGQPLGATHELQGTLHVRLTYQADRELTPDSNWTCGFGHGRSSTHRGW